MIIASSTVAPICAFSALLFSHLRAREIDRQIVERVKERPREHEWKNPLRAKNKTSNQKVCVTQKDFLLAHRRCAVPMPELASNFK